MVGKGTSGGECYGTYNSSTGIGSGAGYVNSCIHSGSSTYAGGQTVWYNYGAASAGSIIGTDNTVITTESICPKGWSLPTKKQSNNDIDITSFSPVLGGFYHNGTLSNESTNGYWWDSGIYSSAHRYILYYDGSSLNTDNTRRYVGSYIRCVSEEKDVSDLTYMQDMTPSILQELCVIVNVLRA